MAFQVSPGISISEVDLTTSVPAISTSVGGIAGIFGWGPVGKILTVNSESALVSKYGKPTTDNFETFFSAANFLAYSNALVVSRAAVVSGFSNTVSSSLNGNTTLTIAALSTSITSGHGVYGTGISSNVTVSSVSTNSTHTIVTLSSAATLGNSSVSNTQNINFYDTDFAFNAIANSANAPSRASYIVKNSDHFNDVSIPAGIEFVAKYPGELGNSLKVSVCDSTGQYSSTVNPYALSGYTNTTVIPTTGGISLEVNSLVANVYISNSSTLDFATTYSAANAMKESFSVGDYVEVGNTSIGKQTLKIKSVSSLANTNPLSPTGQVYFNLTFEEPYAKSINYSSNVINRKWEYSNIIKSAPSTSRTVESKGSTAVDQLSVVVVDQDGKFTGLSGSVLEVFENVSRATDAKNDDGTTAYYQDVLNTNSKYVWSVNDRSGAASALAADVATSTASSPYSVSFIGGTDGITESDVNMAAIGAAMDLFNDSDSVNISLLISGKGLGASGSQSINYLIDNVAEYRKDCVVFASPPRAAVVNNIGSQADAVVEWRNTVRSSSYAFLDSGYKNQYDRYNNVFRWVPLNGDIAGIAARTDNDKDPWWSPAGYQRGQIKNIVKLAWNPSLTDRNTLYAADVNPVANFTGSGTLLFGDKTALGRPSAFDRINVRRLFIVLEKTIATAGHQFLFQFNDEFSRAQFKNLIEPFLRDVQGRKGIYAFKVVCDETNNTGEVLDSNRFVGDIYIKPSKSINYMQLNFVAVGSSVEFSEVIGQF